MSKKTTGPRQPDEGEIPIPYGKKAVQLDHVSVIGKGKQFIVYPSEPLLAHMRDWRFVNASFKHNGSSICGLKLTKAERGFSLRKRQPGRRTHLYISSTLSSSIASVIRSQTNSVTSRVSQTTTRSCLRSRLPDKVLKRYGLGGRPVGFTFHL